jgi:hypothetical protein
MIEDGTGTQIMDGGKIWAQLGDNMKLKDNNNG